jgi:hypothetical protein
MSNTASAPRAAITLDAPPLAQLPEAWRARATELRRLAAADGAARAWECAAQELAAALAQQADELLSLAEAAEISGYHPDSLGRLIREGKLANYGTKRRPKVKRGDLPRRASQSPTLRDYKTSFITDVSAAAIAREAVASRIQRRRGA